MLEAECARALETTRTSIGRAIEWRNGGFSLCHGISGNAEALLYGSDVFGSEATNLLTAAQQVGFMGIESYGKRGGVWPSGVRGEHTPSLMLGLAGIGYFYLRLHDRFHPFRTDNATVRVTSAGTLSSRDWTGPDDGPGPAGGSHPDLT